MGKYSAIFAKKEDHSKEIGNPTFYRGNNRILTLSISSCVIASLLMVLWAVCVYDSCKHLLANKEIEEEIIMLAVLTGFHIILEIMFTAAAIYRESYEGRVPFKLNFSNVFILPFLLLCSLSACVFLYTYHYQKYPSTICILPTIIFFHFFSIVNPSLKDVVNYTPFTKKHQRHVLCSSVEARETQEQYLSIKESGAFKIVIENVGTEDCTGFNVKRRVMYEEIHEYFLLFNNHGFRTSFDMKFVLESPLKPRESVMIIPETHYEPGALKAIGYRSFGYEKCDVIQTIVTPLNHEFAVKLVQKYAPPKSFIEVRV